MRPGRPPAIVPHARGCSARARGLPPLRLIPAAVAAGALLLAVSPALSRPAPPPGASACTGCHDPPGARATQVPQIAGRPADEIASAMLAFRAGEGSPTVMDRIARGFTEEEIRAIAAWFAAPPAGGSP
jgi:cytochrome c553